MLKLKYIIQPVTYLFVFYVSDANGISSMIINENDTTTKQTKTVCIFYGTYYK